MAQTISGHIFVDPLLKITNENIDFTQFKIPLLTHKQAPRDANRWRDL